MPKTVLSKSESESEVKVIENILKEKNQNNESSTLTSTGIKGEEAQKTTSNMKKGRNNLYFFEGGVEGGEGRNQNFCCWNDFEKKKKNKSYLVL